tara:strand:+ start:4161 stop:5975 length:1815 start_codon:yes stop_codon:yes gene_type:complete
MSEEIPWNDWVGVRVPRGAAEPKKNLRIYETGELMHPNKQSTAAMQFRIDSAIKKINIASKQKKYTPKDASSYIKTLCGGDIEVGYGKDEISEADILILSYDLNNDGTQGSLRGFCCVKKHYKPFGSKKLAKGYLYISLICSSGKPSMKTIQQEKKPTLYGSGADMLTWIQWYAQKYNWRAIGLRAINTVIPYYHKFGWQFIYECGAMKERPWMKKYVDELAKLQSKKRKKEPAGKWDIKDQKAMRKAIKKFAHFLPGQHRRLSHSSFTEQKQEAQDYAESSTAAELADIDLQTDEWTNVPIRNTHDAAIDSAMSDGWWMVWCNPNYSSDGGKTKILKDGNVVKVSSDATQKGHHGLHVEQFPPDEESDAESVSVPGQVPRYMRSTASSRARKKGNKKGGGEKTQNKKGGGGDEDDEEQDDADDDETGDDDDVVDCDKSLLPTESEQTNTNMKCFLDCGTLKACDIANEEEKTNINKCWGDCRSKHQRSGNELTPEEEKDIEDEVEREMAELQLDEDVDEVLQRVQREMEEEERIQREEDEEELEKEMATSDGKPNWEEAKGGKRRRKKTRKKRKRRRTRHRRRSRRRKKNTRRRRKKHKAKRK